MDTNESTTGTPLNTMKLMMGTSAMPKHIHCTGFHFFLFGGQAPRLAAFRDGADCRDTTFLSPHISGSPL